MGTKWKGRGVFRAYKTPANPKSCPQRANRDHQKKVLELYQSNVGGDATKEGYWNTDALPRSISGYNLFMMLGRSSRIDCDATHDGTQMAGHYTVTKDISTAGLYVEELGGNTFDVVIAVGEMVAGDDVVFNYTSGGTDDLLFYIVDGRSKNIPPTNTNRDAIVNNWSLDEVSTCAVVQAKSTYTP